MDSREGLDGVYFLTLFVQVDARGMYRKMGSVIFSLWLSFGLIKTINDLKMLRSNLLQYR